MMMTLMSSSDLLYKFPKVGDRKAVCSNPSAFASQTQQRAPYFLRIQDKAGVTCHTWKNGEGSSALPKASQKLHLFCFSYLHLSMCFSHFSTQKRMFYMIFLTCHLLAKES